MSEVVSVEITAKKKTKVLLFGFHEFGVTKNYGNNSNVNIEVIKGHSAIFDHTDKKYFRLLALTAMRPVECYRMTFNVESGNKKEQLSQKITHQGVNMTNGHPIKHTKKISDFIQMVDEEFPMVIDGSKKIFFKMTANKIRIDFHIKRI